MNVVSFIGYARPSVRNRGAFEPALLFATALKRLSKAIQRTDGLDTRSRNQALEWFGSVAAWALRTKDLVPPIFLVPVPNSNCVIDTQLPSRTATLAKAVQAQIPQSIVVDCIRWKLPRVASHNGGIRDCASLLSNLILTSNPPSGGTIVLVDDIVTTGAHLRAAALLLRDFGVNCGEAVCVAKAINGTLFRPGFVIDHFVC